MPKIWDALIIGGGHNGLVTAAYLARGGLKVLVLERREVLGGACVTEEIFPGFKVSTAAYLCSLLNERIIGDLDLARHGYQVYPKDPTFFTPFPDESYLTMWQSQQKTCQEIAKFSGKDAASYPIYEDFIDRLSRFVETLLLKTPPNFVRTRFADLFNLGKLGWSLFRTKEEERLGLVRMFTQSVADFLESWFESEQVRVTLATDGVIGTNGGPRSPGTAYVLLHHVMGKVEEHRGVWGFVRGGMGAVAAAIASAARDSGASIRTAVEVERILVKDGRAVGVTLADGEEIRSRVVISNADPKRTFLGLVEEKELAREFVRQVKEIRMKGSSMKINLALDGLPNFKAVPGSDLMPHHKATIHICPHLDYIERAWDDAKYGQPSQYPLLELTIPTTYDDSLAPPGKHIMGIFLQYTPYDLKDADWSEVKEEYADRVMELIEEYAPGFRNLIVERQVLSPLDLEQTFALTGGNIFHGEMSPDQLFFLRPVPGWAQYRTPIRNLYLCGSGTHPGGGVMGAPGYNAAREILRDWKGV
ncbi:NAD(P)/FAD-dependent oxidoreductase [Acidobacteria bacterium AH-259-O06]|nr:NAD(P)/FAD-dependent oxidoreductase [Acidobacteria bacterium AH-259-O06]